MAEKTPSRAQSAEDDLDNLAGVGMEGVTVSGVKVTKGIRSFMAVGRLSDALSLRWVVRMRCASAAMVGLGTVLEGFYLRDMY